MARPFSWKRFFGRALVLFAAALIPLTLSWWLAPSPLPNLQETAQQAANAFDRLLDLRRLEVFTLAAFPSVRGFTSSTPETRSQRAAVALNELQAWVAADKNVREAFIVDKTGAVILTTLDGWNTDLSRRQFVREALAGQLAISPVARDRAEYSMYYAAPVLNNKQEIAGALVARVAAQELWNLSPQGATWYSVLVDDNGVRLDDSGDPARRLESLGSMDDARAARIANAELYGAELPQLRASNLTRAQQLVTQGALDQLQPGDVGGDALAARRLAILPWTVLIVSSQPALAVSAALFALPLLVALALALAGAWFLERL